MPGYNFTEIHAALLDLDAVLQEHSNGLRTISVPLEPRTAIEIEANVDSAAWIVFRRWDAERDLTDERWLATVAPAVPRVVAVVRALVAEYRAQQESMAGRRA
jgi:hypothetical protein